MPEANLPSPLADDPANLMDLAEVQLQRELRSMFDVDTQTYLQTYISLVQRLQPHSWTADIQELYRCVHTIKGGAVTVGADGILYVSTALEDLLSDLRYLQTAPPLIDGQLAQMLFEAGELLTGSLHVQTVGESALAAVQPTIERLLALRQEIQQVYLPESNERTQMFQEFAEQGFDLVVLDLEMALEQLPGQGKVPTDTLNIAEQTLQQLLQIGKDLEFEQGWTELLQHSQVLLTHLENDFWQAKWPIYLQQVKDCARKGGELSEPIAQMRIPPFPPAQESVSSPPVLQPLVANALPSVQLPTLPETVSTPQKPPQLEELSAISAVVPIGVTSQDSTASIQIPVSLERLDRSAQHLVETLLSARASQGYYQTLQSQLVQLMALTQDSVRYTTQLRQVQDDYALLDNLQGDRNSSAGPTLERYRQGYTLINRLLEASLRLSELGAEVATTAHQTADGFQLLERNILNLQQTVEESRLIPFKTLGFRARGILRDLTNRFGKPAQLIVQGEQLELDAGNVQSLEPALLHLLRNAYDHGLEFPAERVAVGKPEQGTIILSLRRQGNSYLLDLQDDGRGIDAKAIQQLAQTKGLPLTRTDTPAELLAVLCQPGFSSQSLVTAVSGRGVGMDVVASLVASLDGRLSLDTVLGTGTTFQMQIPVPYLLVRCVLVQAENRMFAIPAEEVITTTLWSSLSATQAIEPGMNYSWNIQQDGVLMPGLDLLEYCQQGANARSLSDTAVCLCIRSLSITPSATQQDAWLLADDLLGQADLLINPLPHPLIAPVGLMGVSLQADGKLISVLETATLAERLLTSPAGDSESVTQATDVLESSDRREPPLGLSASLTQTILVVDDAALVRRRIEASLTTYGYVVHTCRDGLEAWNWLRSHPAPAMLITDIEMPGMDGFTLIDRCRQDGMKVPIVVISSRLSEEWGREARRLGATDYLTKGFTTSELIDKVSTYLKGNS